MFSSRWVEIADFVSFVSEIIVREAPPTKSSRYMTPLFPACGEHKHMRTWLRESVIFRVVPPAATNHHCIRLADIVENDIDINSGVRGHLNPSVTVHGCGHHREVIGRCNAPRAASTAIEIDAASVASFRSRARSTEAKRKVIRSLVNRMRALESTIAADFAIRLSYAAKSSGAYAVGGG